MTESQSIQVQLASAMAIVELVRKSLPQTFLIEELVLRLVEYPIGLEVLTMCFSETDDRISFSVPLVLTELVGWTNANNLSQVLKLVHSCLVCLA